jgi:tRNA(fMet)-specific endonuclease VapC
VRYLLDTNVCVDYLRGRKPVVRRLRDSDPNDLCLSSIVVAELRYGAERSADPARNDALLDGLIREVPCVDFDLDAAAAYGRLRSRLEQRGEPIGPNDLMIAAHALSLGLILVTDNLHEFRRVEGLRVETWREPAGSD